MTKLTLLLRDLFHLLLIKLGLHDWAALHMMMFTLKNLEFVVQIQ